MKMVDEKGKLFGKINIIDFLILVLLVLALAVVGWKIVQNRSESVIGVTTPTTYTTRLSAVDAVTSAEILKYVDKASGKKDQLMANGEMLDAYVVDAVIVPHPNYNADAQGNTVVSYETGEGARVDMIFTVEANIENPTINRVGTQEVRVGKAHILKTIHFEFGYTVITHCGPSEQ